MAAADPAAAVAAAGEAAPLRNVIKLAGAFQESQQYPQMVIHEVVQAAEASAVYITHMEHQLRDNVCLVSMSLHKLNMQNGRIETVGKLVGHTSTVNDVCFGGRGLEGLVLSASDDGTVRLWDLQTGKQVRQLKAGKPKHYRNRQVPATEFNSCCGQNGIIVGAAADNTVYLWDAKTGAVVSVIEHYHQEQVLFCRFHPTSSSLLVTADQDGLINVFDMTKRAPRDPADAASDDEDDDDLNDEYEEALIAVLNCEQSVRRLGFFGPQMQYIFVLTRIETLQVWEPTSKENPRVCDHPQLRQQLTKQCGRVMDSLVDCHLVGTKLFLVAGGSDGAVLLAHVTANRITPFALCPGAPQDEEGRPLELQAEDGAPREDPRRNSHVAAVRASLWVREVLLTAGEDGKLVAWTPRR